MESVSVLQPTTVWWSVIRRVMELREASCDGVASHSGN